MFLVFNIKTPKLQIIDSNLYDSTIYKVVILSQWSFTETM